MVAGSLVVGWLTLLGPVEDFNVDSFDEIVTSLTSVPGLVELSETLTDAGKLEWNYVMLAAIAIVALARSREAAFSWVVVCAVTTLGVRSFQGIVSRLVDGTEPTGELVNGVGGPYFSGGVFRVVVVAGLALAVLGARRRLVYGGALLAGVAEGVTRMALGRHWILDAAAAVPIGLGVLWCLLEFARLLQDLRPADRTVPSTQ